MSNEQDPSMLDVVWKVAAGAAMVLSGIITWIGKYYITANREDHDRFDERIRVLETEVARKGDVQFVARQIDDMRRDIMAELLRKNRGM